MTDTAELTSPWLTTAEVAALIRTDDEYVRRQCKNGALKATKLGTGWRIHRDAVDQFMAAPAGVPPTRKRTSARQKRRSVA